MKILLAIIISILFSTYAMATSTCYDHIADVSWGECVCHSDCQEGTEWYRWCVYQNDVDGDGVCDRDDTDTMWGYITGDGGEGRAEVEVDIAEVVATTTTDENGYYAVGGLYDLSCAIPVHQFSTFTPNYGCVEINQ